MHFLEDLAVGLNLHHRLKSLLLALHDFVHGYLLHRILQSRGEVSRFGVQEGLELERVPQIGYFGQF